MVRRTSAGRLLPGLIAVLLLAGIYGLATAGHPVSLAAGQPVQPHSAPVSAVQRICPIPGQVTSPGSGIALIAAPATAGAGRARVTRLSPGSAGQLLSATQPGRLSTAGVPTAGPLPPPGSSQPGSTGQGSTGNGSSGPAVPAPQVRGGVMVQASGSMARGLAADQLSPGRIPAAPCQAPGTDFWFTGPGAHSASQIRLFLANPASTAADVNVEIATDAGPLQGRPDTGITVPPHSMVRQNLAGSVSGSRVVALHVRTSVGQVAAAVQESTGGSGGAWLPVAQAPARQVIVPGLPPTSGSRQLFLAVPGERDAHVTISAVTSRGTYQPTGGGGIDVPAGSAIEVTLPSLAGIPAALKLKSSIPVTASAMISGGGTGAPGLFTAASPAIEEQGVAAANLSGGGEDSELILSAPRGRAKVRITELGTSGAGKADDRVVTVKARKSKSVPLRHPEGSRAGSAFSAVITPLPGSGPLYAGRIVLSSQTATAQALLPVESALTSVPLPPAVNTSVSSG